jgi:hypothetical protein
MKNDKIWIGRGYKQGKSGLIVMIATYAETTRNCVKNYLRWRKWKERGGPKKGWHDPSFDILSRILEAAGVSLSEIFEDNALANLISFVPPENRGDSFSNEEFAEGRKRLKALLKKLRPQWVWLWWARSKLPAQRR